MMILQLLRVFGPYVAIAAVLIAVFFAGYHAAEKHHIEYVAQLRAASSAELEKARQHNAAISQTLAESARVIDETYQQKTLDIQSAADNNRAALAGRLRRDSASCNNRAMSSSAESTGVGVVASAGRWVVSDAVAQRLIERHAIADNVTAIAASCQAYVKQLQQEFK